MTRAEKGILVGLSTAVAIFAIGVIAGTVFTAPAPPTFEGDSDQLSRTQIAATRATPVESGNNTIWCASFVSAWKQLLSDVAEGIVVSDGAEELCAALNDAEYPTEFVPEESLYAAAGWLDEGIIQRVQEDMAAKFPGRAVPPFSELSADTVAIAYAYLETSLAFRQKYIENPEPLPFVASNGTETGVRSFGIRPGDEAGPIRYQPEILYVEPENSANPAEFAVDLDSRSTPHQLIVACIPPQETLQAAFDYLKRKVEDQRKRITYIPFDSRDTLLVPSLSWFVRHRFRELEGSREHPIIEGPLATDYWIEIARQDIQFKLDRSGAQLRSESRVEVALSTIDPEKPPVHYIFDRPFLICMKLRKSEDPYFLMWVDNAELLRAW